MRIDKVAVSNFRLLKEVELSFDAVTTVVVGRNNSGKTSLTELFRRLLSGNAPQFTLEDFSLGCYDKFWDGFVLARAGSGAEDVRSVLPVIVARLTVSYDVDAVDLGVLSEFVIDLNPSSSQTVIEIRFEIERGKVLDLYEGLLEETDAEPSELKRVLFKALKSRVPALYNATLSAIDPGDPTNQKLVQWSKLAILLNAKFISAHRGLDDTSSKASQVLGHVVQALFESARSASANQNDKAITANLEVAVAQIEQNLDNFFNASVTNLLPAFALFGYPNLSDPHLCTETSLDVGRLLDDHTRVRYTGVHGVTLPETYNGLGTRNLIYILLRIFEFFKEYSAAPVASCAQVIFIEEPEAHLHPQMQEVFIRQLAEIIKAFEHTSNENWPVQFIVTTHSSHIANEAPFDCIRYFLAKPGQGNAEHFATHIKDLKTCMSEEPEENRAFLHEFVTLTKCDLLFADKAVLIEGTSERILLPKMMNLVQDLLRSQYVARIEVGGAYAHRFFKLLEFLELRSLIVTDLDSGVHNSKNRIVESKVSQGTHTTNACLKTWFANSGVTPTQLLAMTDAQKTRGNCRLAYQVPETEGAPCGRSFEGAFILANLGLFNIAMDASDKEEEAWIKSKRVNKVEFAIQRALQPEPWSVPRYITEGLEWLAGPATDSPTETISPSTEAS